ncbi:MAG: hypothetical protein N2560_00005, partial [Ignavibacteria bacterium]|nr:hypothetical protein [Ignavibacteria bacterium]
MIARMQKYLSTKILQNSSRYFSKKSILSQLHNHNENFIDLLAQAFAFPQIHQQLKLNTNSQSPPSKHFKFNNEVESRANFYSIFTQKNDINVVLNDSKLNLQTNNLGISTKGIRNDNNLPFDFEVSIKIIGQEQEVSSIPDVSKPLEIAKHFPIDNDTIKKYITKEKQKITQNIAPSNPEKDIPLEEKIEINPKDDKNFEKANVEFNRIQELSSKNLKKDGYDLQLEVSQLINQHNDKSEQKFDDISTFRVEANRKTELKNERIPTNVIDINSQTKKEVIEKDELTSQNSKPTPVRVTDIPTKVASFVQNSKETNLDNNTTDLRDAFENNFNQQTNKQITASKQFTNSSDFNFNSNSEQKLSVVTKNQHNDKSEQKFDDISTFRVEANRKTELKNERIPTNVIDINSQTKKEVIEKDELTSQNSKPTPVRV